MSVTFDEEALDKLCKEIGGKQSKALQELFKTLVDEEFQVRHLIRPHRIIKRIEETIDQHLEVDG
jgi:hypothetical protein